MAKTMSLRAQLLLCQVAIILVTVVATGIVAGTLQERQLRDAYLDRMLGVARSVANLPAITDAFDDPDPSAAIQPIAEVIREASKVTYVVVTDRDGIRFSHPTPGRIGERVSTDPGVALSGRVFVGTETGTLGDSWRAKVPIFSPEDPDEVIGQVSVGILESDLSADLREEIGWLVVALVVAAIAGGLGAAWVTRLIRRRIHGLEPEQIAGLLEGREAILHGTQEGLIAFDDRGRVLLANDAAGTLLGLADPSGAEGRLAADVLEPELARLAVAGDGDEHLVLAGERRLIARSDAVSGPSGPIGTALTLRDHTALHETLAELEGANSLAEGMRAQAHEFANRLHVIGGLLELGEAEAALDYVGRVSTDGLLVTLGEAEALGGELTALLLAKRARALELGVRLDLDPEQRWLAPRGEDPLRDDALTVVGNLLDNAIEAAGPGGAVRLGLSRGAGRVRIVAEDSGPGVNPEERERVFLRGVSSKGAGGVRGLGLTLVRRVARRLGGDATIGVSALGGARVDVACVDPAARPSPGTGPGANTEAGR
ncbi:sensor histidine kinase [Leucobacter sp. M11]|uniref:sensor histidine kinase n=1 Tax=Leucobacter sp. M11 TaxID=2993565 RepID=UPI002D80E093|nr:sensor histidine kinase [Leucobacter sp. M11]MEB4615534.1 sensor histidine kinase [Leucobacter sp. M11]